jgi:hypothetical protein
VYSVIYAKQNSFRKENFVKKTISYIFFMLSIAFSGQIAFSQAPVNPDISFIGDFRLSGHKNAPSDLDENKFKFDFEELEIAANGYLNPYARADITMGIDGTGGEIDIEEAYATLLRGLPLNLQIRAGQYLVDFGKINTQHAHQWSWILRPLMFQQFFGEEGLKDVGVNVTSMIPVGKSALTLSGNLLQGDFLLGENADNVTPDMGGSARLSLFSPVGTYSSLEAGISGLLGEFDPINKRWAKMGDVDFKYKWRPNVYQSLVVVGESMINSRKINQVQESNEDIIVESKDIRSFGAFSSIDYQFKRRFNVGALVDYSQTPEADSIYQIGYGLFAGFSLAEETYRISLLLRQDDGKGWRKPYQTVIVQLLWSLGPHKPHTF